MIKITILTALFTALILLSCNPNKKADNFDWLLGKWQRLNEETGKETFENWEKVNPYHYRGIGFTMQDGDTIKQESIKIIQQEGKWSLIVKVPEEIESITFPITELKNDKFTCTNDTLDFPKKIRYWKSGKNIKAMVEGDFLKIDFEFVRQ